MNIWIPFTEIEAATEAAVRPYLVNRIRLTEEDSYVRYFEERWAERRTFINLEHDVVPWPGALDELWACPQPWCAFGYRPGENLAQPDACAYLGCAKIGEALIARLPNVWRDKPAPRVWSNCDCWLTTYARQQRIVVHQHYPAVVNV